MKFEEHEGQLFRMLEKPVPLAPDSKLPCLVRLIQDDSPMGRFNKMHSFTGNILQNTYLAQRVTDYSKHANDGKMPINCYAHYEIIGYPVEEGSAEWALWAMMDGKKVWSFDVIDIIGEGYVAMGKWESSEVIAFHFVNTDTNYECNDFMSIDEFLSKHRSSGWQIYKEHAPEPKPLLADAKVGDLCQRMDGKWVQIETLCSLGGMPWICYEIGGLRYINNGEQLNTKDRNLDIIDYHPLAPEGSAEWAWQMLMLGKTVYNPSYYYSSSHGLIAPNMLGNCSKQSFVGRQEPSGWQLYKEPKPEPDKEPEIVAHKQHANCLVCGKEIEGLLDGHVTVSIKRYSISSLYESTYSHYCGKCFLELGFDATERELRNRQQPIAEPKPEPAKEQFDVGDWVEFIDAGGRKSQGKYLSNTDGNAIIVLDITSNMRVVVHTTKIIRKLSPIDVEVDFGFAKGRILSRTSGNVKVLNNKSVVIASIIVSEITNPTTRSLVESLLEAQEEK